jgi:hypothetical protein
MEAIRILEKPTAITWDYDEDADVLYLSLGEPQPAVGVDIGEGVIVRYDEGRQERSRGTDGARFAHPAPQRPERGTVMNNLVVGSMVLMLVTFGWCNRSLTVPSNSTQ